MLHLLRFNLIIYLAAVASSVGSLCLAGMDFFSSIKFAAPIAGLFQLVTLVFIFVGWKYIPGFSWFVFPNIAGQWTGKIEYQRNGATSEIIAELTVDQNVNAIVLVLQTEDAESETVIVHPRRLSNDRFELLYVYETHRKVGRPSPFYRYRGTAIIRVEDKSNQLVGTYYTEQGGGGTVRFVRAAT